MATNPEISFTNLETSAQTGWFRCLVPWSTGDIADLATLQANRKILFNGTERDVVWSTFGPDHQDGSVRHSVAEFQATIPAGVAVPQAPQLTARVVTGTNSAPTPDFSAFDALWANTEIAISYTDPRDSTAYSLNLLTVARAGTNNATYTETTVGARKIIRAEAYMGPGTHAEQLRVGGFNTQTAAITTTGNLHVRLWLEVTADMTHAQGVIGYYADSCYPSPAEPPDAGARDPARPHRPTYLQHDQGEKLDDELVLEFDADFQVDITCSSTSLYAHPWYTPNAANGESIWGRMTRSAITDGTRVTMPIRGLGHRQGWPWRFCAAWTSGAAWVDSSRFALRPYTFLGLPTHDTWMDTHRTGTLPSPWDGDSIDIRGGAEIPLLEVPAAQRAQWFLDGQVTYDRFMVQNQQALGWSGRTRNWPWHLFGREHSPGNSGGSQPQFGHMKEGRTWLANSTYDLYVLSAATTREHGGLRGGMCWGLEDEPLLHTHSDHRLSSWWTGSSLHRDSYNAHGDWSRPEINPERRPNDPSGAPASVLNPEWVALQGTNREPEETWKGFDHGHWGTVQSFHFFLMTQDYYTADMIQHHAELVLRMQCPRFYVGKNPSDRQTRGEARPNRTWFHAWIIDGDSKWPSAFSRRLNQYLNGQVGQRVSPLHRWHRWPVLAALANGSHTNCGYPVSSRVQKDPAYVPWQSAYASTFYLNMGFEWQDLHSTEATTAIRWVRESIRTTIEHCLVAQPTFLSAGATRTIDNCWSPFINGTPNANDVADALRAHYFTSRFFYVNAQDADPWDIRTDITTEFTTAGTYIGGEVLDNYMLMRMWDVFADFRADAEITERAEFFVDRMIVFEGQRLGPTGYVGSKGVSCHIWRGTGGFNPPGPSVAAAPRAGFAPLTVSFDATASTVGGNRSSATFRWWFEYSGNSGDPPDLEATPAGSPQIETPTYTYTSSGEYDVRLEIEDSAGQATDIVYTGLIEISLGGGAAPIVSFTAAETSGYAPFEVELLNATTGAHTYKWTVTEANGLVHTATEHTPIFSLREVGKATISLLASNTWGTGIQERVKYLEVLAPVTPTAFFTVSPSVGTSPTTVTFTNLSTNANTYLWRFGDDDDSPATSVLQNPPAREYVAQKTYFIELQVTSVSGHVDTYEYPLVITPDGGQDETATAEMLGMRIYPQTATAMAETNGATGSPSHINLTLTQHDATGEVNPGAAPVLDALTLTLTQYDATASFTQSATGSPTHIDLSLTQYDATGTVANIPAHAVATMQRLTLTQYTPTSTAGTGDTGSASALMLNLMPYDATASVVEHETGEPSHQELYLTQYDATAGQTQNVAVQVEHQTMSLTQYDAEGLEESVRLAVLELTLTQPTVRAFINYVPEEDLVELRGNRDRAVSLRGDG